ncbi:hypothetical protein D3C81_1157020 [compost metagenome]
MGVPPQSEKWFFDEQIVNVYVTCKEKRERHMDIKLYRIRLRYLHEGHSVRGLRTKRPHRLPFNNGVVHDHAAFRFLRLDHANQLLAGKIAHLIQWLTDGR